MLHAMSFWEEWSGIIFFMMVPCLIVLTVPIDAIDKGLILGGMLYALILGYYSGRGRERTTAGKRRNH